MFLTDLTEFEHSHHVPYWPGCTYSEEHRHMVTTPIDIIMYQRDTLTVVTLTALYHILIEQSHITIFAIIKNLVTLKLK